MRLVLRLLVVATSVLAIPSPAVAGPSSAAAERAVFERLMYQVSLSSFVAARGTDTRFDWSSDDCTAPLVGSTGRSFNFRSACKRHDFGYRNLKLLQQRHGNPFWNSAERQRVDDRFRADMRSHCFGRPWFDQPTCLMWAETYYRAVRIGGGP